jgi:hypothetical protein
LIFWYNRRFIKNNIKVFIYWKTKAKRPKEDGYYRLGGTQNKSSFNIGNAKYESICSSSDISPEEIKEFKQIRTGLAKELRVYGGENAPYLWVKTPNDTPSWKFFEEMLYGASVVCTPGVGFGPSGEGYIRLTAFGEHEDCKEAMERIAKWLGK